MLVLLGGVVRPARAQNLEYSAIDRATVRVFALSGIEMVTLKAKRTGSTHAVASARAGHGSGLLLSRQGLIVTAFHVVDGARFIAVKKPGSGEALPARIVYASRLNDIAFLAIPGEHADYVELPEKGPALRARQTVYALGYPLDSRSSDPQSSRGIVSGLGPEGELQLSISVNPGNSGGPVFDEGNVLLGVISKGADPTKGAQGIGLAVPVDKVLALHKKGVTTAGFAAIRQNLANASANASSRAVTKLVVDFTQQGNLLEDIIGAMDEASMGQLRGETKKVYDDEKAQPDALSLAAAYYWNEAVAGYVLRQENWETAQRLSKALCSKASKQDPTIEARSPFVAAALGRATNAHGYRLSNSATITNVTNLQDYRGTPKAKAPSSAMGFNFGASLDAVKQACEREGHRFEGDGATFRCSGPAQEVSYTADVELGFCEGKLCSLDLLTRPSKGLSEPWWTRFGAFKKYYEDRYGPPMTDVFKVPSACRGNVLPCLKGGTAAMRYVWRWPDHEISIAMGRFRGEPVIKISHRRR
jgi:hypothetical protein